MRSGALRDRITIEQLDSSQDVYGAPSQSWGVFATAWANVEALSGRELIAAQAAQSEVSYRITIRYVAGVKAKMRARQGATIFNIHAVRDPDGFRRELVLDCGQGVNLG